MTSWGAIVDGDDAFAARLLTIFSAGTNKTLATSRADGSPRISGTELSFTDTRVSLGMMPNSRKLADVLRDPRVAIHSPTIEPPQGSLGLGDAKLAGILVPIDPPGPDAVDGLYFELDITEAVVTWVADDLLWVESWHPGRGVERISRS